MAAPLRPDRAILMKTKNRTYLSFPIMENGNYTVQRQTPSKPQRAPKLPDTGPDKPYLNQDGIKRNGVA